MERQPALFTSTCWPHLETSRFSSAGVVILIPPSPELIFTLSTGSTTSAGLETLTPPSLQFSFNTSRRRAYSCSATTHTVGRIHSPRLHSPRVQSPLRTGRQTPPNCNPSVGVTTPLPAIPSSPTKDNPTGDICGNVANPSQPSAGPPSAGQTRQLVHYQATPLVFCLEVTNTHVTLYGDSCYMR